MLFLADDSSASIRGNEAGLLHLALELMEVSSGGQVSPSASTWLDLAWLPLEAITLEHNPQIEESSKSVRDSILAVTIVVLVCIVFVSGFVTCLNWVSYEVARLIHHLR